MVRKSWYFSSIGLMIAAQAGCVAENASIRCTVDGAAYFKTLGSEDRICEDFVDRLGRALSSRDKNVRISNLAIGIEFKQPGTVSATIEQRIDDEVIRHPTVSVDVLDRALSEEHLARLADNAAEILLED